jgi:hypothetical protein
LLLNFTGRLQASFTSEPVILIAGDGLERLQGKLMHNLSVRIRMTMGLGVLSLLALFLSHLALTDIAHGESEVSLEWRILRVSALLILMFIASALVTLWQVLKLERAKGGGHA